MLTQPPYTRRPISAFPAPGPAEVLSADRAAWSSVGLALEASPTTASPQGLRLVLIPSAGETGSFVMSHTGAWCQQGRVTVQGQLRRWGLRNNSGWKVKVKVDNGPGDGTVRAGARVCGSTTPCADRSHLLRTFCRYQGSFTTSPQRHGEPQLTHRSNLHSVKFSALSMWRSFPGGVLHTV